MSEMDAAEFGIWDGALEIRASGGKHTLTGTFPYGNTATISNSGRTRKERFASGSMSWQVREFGKLQTELAETIQSAIDKARKELLIERLEDALEKRNTFLLVGHDYNRAIADMRTGNLAIQHTAAAVKLEAELPALSEMPSWVKDAVLAVRGGQLRGISPGFQVTSKGAQRLIPEAGNPGVMIREIQDAVVYEYSLVARPAYAMTDVTARAANIQHNQGERRRLWL